MLLIPTEKRFDWQHAPYILFSLVLLNCLIFFYIKVETPLNIFKQLTNTSNCLISN